MHCAPDLTPLSTIASHVGWFAGIVNFDEVSPGIGLAAINIGKAVDSGKLPARQRPPIPRDTLGSAASAAAARPTKAGFPKLRSAAGSWWRLASLIR